MGAAPAVLAVPDVAATRGVAATMPTSDVKVAGVPHGAMRAVRTVARDARCVPRARGAHGDSDHHLHGMRWC